MTFHVYDNWTINKARVHRSTCSYCRDGQGIHGNPNGRNSRWHGPFLTLVEAEKVAKSLKRVISDHCRFCSPAG